MKVVVFTITVAVAIWSAAAERCIASVPAMMSYQGKLTDASGQAVPDGVYNMRFYLWATESGGTTPLWQEPAAGTRQIQVTGGLFNVLLGSIVALPDSAFRGDTWLESEVNGTLLLPRIRIVSAGYAMRALIAEGLPANTVTSDMIVDGTVQAADIAPDTITTDKVSPSGGSAGQAITHNGTDVVWGNPTAGDLNLPYSKDVSTSQTAFRIGNAGTGGAGRFEISNASGGGNVLSASTSGTGKAGHFEITKALNSSAALYATTIGSGPAVHGQTGAATAVKGESTGAGIGVHGVSVSGYAGYFQGTTGVVGNLTVQDTGRLGVGITSPTERIQVAGNVKLSLAGGGVIFPDLSKQTSAAVGDGYSLDASDGSPVDALYVDASGRVGIGTTTPGAKLDVTNLTRVQGYTWPSSGAGLELGYNATANKGYVQAFDRDTATFGDLYLGSGNVGIGIGSPTTRLDVVGDLKLDGAYRGNLGTIGGAPFPRPAYDSGWTAIAQGATTTCTHNLGGSTDDYMVDLQFKDTDGDLGVNQAYYGGLVTSINAAWGAWWSQLTTSSIKVRRSGEDPAANQFRLRIWVVK